MLEVTAFSLDQLDITTTQVLASYCYKDIKAVQEVSDVVDGFVIISAPDDRLVRVFHRESPGTKNRYSLLYDFLFDHSTCFRVETEQKFLPR